MTKDEAIKLYHNIDAATEKHYEKRKKQPPCSNGCASCCSQFFEISEIEFELISDMIMNWSVEDKTNLFIRSNILFDTFKEHWPNFANSYFTPDTIHLNNDDYYIDPERFEVAIPCVFLSDEGSCTIYDRRPNICRTTGVGFQHLINKGAVCNYIKLGLTTPLWQADLRVFRDDIDALRWQVDPLNPDRYQRQYPMFYYVHRLSMK